MKTLERHREENRAAIAKALDAIQAYARLHHNIRTVIQFGSTAHGRIDALSDLDLLVVMESDKDYFSRSADILAAIAAPADIDIICYTPQEIMRNRDRPFLHHILQEGKIIYEKPAV